MSIRHNKYMACFLVKSRENLNEFDQSQQA